MLSKKTSVDVSSSSTLRPYKTDVNEKLRKCGLLKGENVNLRTSDFFRGTYKYPE